MLELTEKQIENIRRDPNQQNWYNISYYYKLSEDLIKEFQYKVNWIDICEFQKLSDNFIRKNISRLNKKILLKNENISEEIKQTIKFLL